MKGAEDEYVRVCSVEQLECNIDIDTNVSPILDLDTKDVKDRCLIFIMIFFTTRVVNGKTITVKTLRLVVMDTGASQSLVPASESGFMYDEKMKFEAPSTTCF